MLSAWAQNGPGDPGNGPPGGPPTNPFAAYWTNDIVSVLGTPAIEWANPDLVWVEDGLPAGADTGLSAQQGAGLVGGPAVQPAEAWLWTNAWLCDGGWVQPLSGSLMQVSPLAPGLHGHSFVAPASGMIVLPGDSLVAYLRIGSNSAPSEVMLEWFAAGSWEHRAYWGADAIAPPAQAGANRFYAGPLPAVGQWAQLAIPAEAVDLAGQIVQGMAFTLYDGEAAWDRVGRTRPNPAVTGFSPATAGAMVLAPETQSCYSPAPSPAGWWRAEGNTDDQAGLDNGSWQGNAAYMTGEVGQAFSMDGRDNDVIVAASPTVNVGAGGSLTVECWVNPSDSACRPIVEWNSGAGLTSYGAHLWASQTPPHGTGAGCLYANLIDTSNTVHYLCTGAAIVYPNTRSHVAVTYNGATGYGALYVNGVNCTNQYLGFFIPQTSYNMYIGARPPVSTGATNWWGGIDEVSIYNAALPGWQIDDIFLAGSAGKCTVSGSPVYLTSALSYQYWQRDGTYYGNGSINSPYGGRFDYILANLTSANQTIILGSGTFYTSGENSLQQGQSLVGNPKGSTLQLMNPQSDSVTAVLDLYNDGASIRNLTLECDTNQANNLTNYSVRGVNLDANNCVVSGVTVRHATGWYQNTNLCPGCEEVGAIEVGWAPNTYYSNNLVEGCTITNCAGDGINGIILQRGGAVQNNGIWMSNTIPAAGMCINSGGYPAAFTGNYCAGGANGFYNDTGWNSNVLVQANTFVGQNGAGVAMGAGGPPSGFQGITNLTLSGNTIAPWGITASSWGILMANALGNPSVPIAAVNINSNKIYFSNTLHTNYLPPNCYTLNLYAAPCTYLSNAPPYYFWNCYIGHNQIQPYNANWLAPHTQFQMQSFTIDHNTDTNGNPLNTAYFPADGTYTTNRLVDGQHQPCQ